MDRDYDNMYSRTILYCLCTPRPRLKCHVMLKYSKAHVLCMKRQQQHHKVYVTRVSNGVKHKKLTNLREHITEKNLSGIARITRIT